MTEAARILVLDDDPDVGTAARLLLRRRFGSVELLTRPAELLPQLERGPADVLLLDMNFTPGRSDGEEGLRLLRQALSRVDAPAVVMMTAYAEIDLAVQALKLGAFDFITKPWDNQKLVATVNAALASRQPRVAASSGSLLLGESVAMRELRALIASVAPTEANVLVLGEMGSGKELVAQEIHARSKRAGQAFLAVDLGALPETTMESELFGHRRGSFTDARSDRLGRFQAAQGGTIFLDEIGNLPLQHQAKLLTALERREVTALGADRAEAIDVRVVSATNLSEQDLFDAQRFRPDLLYRLNTIVLRVPPLRERRDDIALIVNHYLGKYAAQYDKPPRSLSDAAVDALQRHDWHGNVRALRHACERAVILATGARFEPGDFCLQSPPTAADAGPRMASLNERERAALDEALREAQGNISQAARLLGLSRAALYRRMEKHGL
ncbi:sigma-54-dependent transcriptional regulator [Roseateles microcysteis]|uniref:sigma-54-dependent transcriptional regulator n=1 Tax=Roseateles microcysteis TaxID=3119057 RepID=UPI002FE56BB2